MPNPLGEIREACVGQDVPLDDPCPYCKRPMHGATDTHHPWYGGGYLRWRAANSHAEPRPSLLERHNLGGRPSAAQHNTRSFRCGIRSGEQPCWHLGPQATRTMRTTQRLCVSILADVVERTGRSPTSSCPTAPSRMTRGAHSASSGKKLRGWQAHIHAGTTTAVSSIVFVGVGMDIDQAKGSCKGSKLGGSFSIARAYRYPHPRAWGLGFALLRQYHQFVRPKLVLVVGRRQSPDTGRRRTSTGRTGPDRAVSHSLAPRKEYGWKNGRDTSGCDHTFPAGGGVEGRSTTGTFLQQRQQADPAKRAPPVKLLPQLQMLPIFLFLFCFALLLATVGGRKAG